MQETKMQPGLEELFSEAETIIEKLEQPGIDLEEAFAAYEQGMKVIKACNDRIDEVEKKMQILTADGTVVPFDQE
ncbi:MAG: exodeoxyribonuclease VII small subunit [bacterium]|nr:exodeoxyribonuclease VII small subunit [bacterium]